MEKIISILFFFILFIGCENKKINSNSSIFTIKEARACKKCNCVEFRPDSEDPDSCINIRAPKKSLCGHSEKDHK